MSNMGGGFHAYRQLTRSRFWAGKLAVFEKCLGVRMMETAIWNDPTLAHPESYSTHRGHCTGRFNLQWDQHA